MRAALVYFEHCIRGSEKDVSVVVPEVGPDKIRELSYWELGGHDD